MCNPSGGNLVRQELPNINDRASLRQQPTVQTQCFRKNAPPQTSNQILYTDPTRGASNVGCGWNEYRQYIHTGKFVYTADHCILLRLSPFDLRVDREGWWFEHSVSKWRLCLSAENAKNVSLPWLYPLQGWGSLTVYIYTSNKLLQFTIDLPFCGNKLL